MTTESEAPGGETPGAGGWSAGAGSGTPVPSTVSVGPPTPNTPSTPSTSYGVPTSPSIQQEEALLLQEEYALEAQYGITPSTPTTTPTPTPPATPVTHQPTSHDASTHQPPQPTTNAPSDLTYDSAGQPVQGTEPTSHVIGNPVADESQWSFQVANGYCGPNSISMMIEAATGHHLTEQQIAQWAISNHEMTHLPPQDDPAGIPSIHYGMLPDQAANTLNALGSQYGISATIQQGNMHDLESCLRQGREVMIELDDQRIWHQPGVADTNVANHYVVVTGFDPSTNTVFINDPGTPDGKMESLPLKEFESAWSTSNNVMIVTTINSSSSGGPTTPGTPAGPSGGSVASGGRQPGPVLLPVTMSGTLLGSV